MLNLVSPHTQFEWNERAPDLRVSTKLRTIDPHILINGHAQPLSSLDPAFASQRAEYLRAKSGKWPMRVLPPPLTS
jgi:hypothetical protein